MKFWNSFLICMNMSGNPYWVQDGNGQFPAGTCWRWQQEHGPRLGDPGASLLASSTCFHGISFTIFFHIVWRILILEIIFRATPTLVVPCTPGCLLSLQSWNKFFWKANNWHWNERDKGDGCKEEGTAGVPMVRALCHCPWLIPTQTLRLGGRMRYPGLNSKWLSRENNCFTVCKTETTVCLNTRHQSVMISVHSPNKSFSSISLPCETALTCWSLWMGWWMFSWLNDCP